MTNTEVLNDMYLTAPEIWLLFLGCSVLLLAVYLPNKMGKTTFYATQIGLVVTAVLVWFGMDGSSQMVWSDHLVVDRLASILKLFILLTAFLSIFYAKAFFENSGQALGEFFTLAIFAVLGMFTLVSGQNFLTLYLGLELLALCQYAMVAMYKNSDYAGEAAIKYFVLGAMASGMLLYGVSLLYGVTGSLQLSEISASLTQFPEQRIILSFAVAFIVIGMAFKLGAAPFHMWIPDVYQGAPTAIVIFIGAAPKIAVLGLLLRVLVDGLEAIQLDWGRILIVLSIISIALGNVIAISQKDIKRMLGYSTIAHAGYLLLGILTGTAQGYAASMYYSIAYTLMVLAAFALVIVVEKHQGSTQLDAFKGLVNKDSWLAFLVLIVMLSMAGVPPFLGFWAKWFVLKQVVSEGMTWLAIVAVIFSIIGLFYYLRVIRMAYFDEQKDDTALTQTGEIRLVASVNALAILVLGILPMPLIYLCASVF